jgi:hypothetical protein
MGYSETILFPGHHTGKILTVLLLQIKYFLLYMVALNPQDITLNPQLMNTLRFAFFPDINEVTFLHEQILSPASSSSGYHPLYTIKFRVTGTT